VALATMVGPPAGAGRGWHACMLLPVMDTARCAYLRDLVQIGARCACSRREVRDRSPPGRLFARRADGGDRPTLTAYLPPGRWHPDGGPAWWLFRAACFERAWHRWASHADPRHRVAARLAQAQDGQQFGVSHARSGEVSTRSRQN
jgi:hypothetical protein